jgi:hypothetical protein
MVPGFLAALGESAPEVAGGGGSGKRPRPVSDARATASPRPATRGAAADVAEIPRTSPRSARGLAEDEAADRDQADFALAELKEYVRVSAQIVFEELRPRRAAQSRDVH